jgi:peptidyl-prolyl cis-trans isomerase SurA
MQLVLVQTAAAKKARGLVINDYQAYLGEEWIKELKKKYPVKVNDAVFKPLLKQ